MCPPSEPFFSWAGGRERSRVQTVCFLGLHTVTSHELPINTCIYKIRQLHASLWNQISNAFCTSTHWRIDNNNMQPPEALRLNLQLCLGIINYNSNRKLLVQEQHWRRLRANPKGWFGVLEENHWLILWKRTCISFLTDWMLRERDERCCTHDSALTNYFLCSP